MATRKVVPLLVRTCAAPGIRAGPVGGWRQGRSFVVVPPPSCRGATGPARRVAAAVFSIARPSCRRAYSQSNENKIWSFEDVQRLVKEPEANIIIVDVREPAELKESGRIPGAVNIPVKSAPDSFHLSEDEFEDRFGFPRPARDAEIVLYCRSGVRSRAAAGLARDAGWHRVGEYPGSWLDWAEKGGKAER